MMPLKSVKHSICNHSLRCLYIVMGAVMFLLCFLSLFLISLPENDSFLKDLCFTADVFYFSR